MAKCKIPKDTTYKQKARAFDLLYSHYGKPEKFREALKVVRQFNK